MTGLGKYCTLSRLPLSFFAACSAGTGALLACRTPSAAALLSFTGVFLLVCGSSALNQVQERDIDALMERTKGRPLPAGRMTPRRASAVAAILLAAGFIPVAFTGALPLLLSGLAVIWYNGLYTRLKKKTAFAAVFGSLVGAIPPAIGWTACGGALDDPRLAAVGALFVLWQVPHFWLLLLRSGEDYARAGLPVLTAIIPRDRLLRITVVWIAAAAAASVALPLYGVIVSPLAAAVQVLAAFWLAGSGMRLAGRAAANAPRALFLRINGFLLLAMLTVMLDALLSRAAGYHHALLVR